MSATTPNTRRIPDAEATAYPWWVIIDPRQNMQVKRGHGPIANMVTGPFLSRETAQQHLDGRRYAFGEHAKVYCMSGYWSRDWKALCEEPAPTTYPPHEDPPHPVDLPEGWGAAPHGPMVCGPVWGDLGGMTVEATEHGVEIRDTNGKATVIPTAVWLWLADRLRPKPHDWRPLTSEEIQSELAHMSATDIKSSRTMATTDTGEPDGVVEQPKAPASEPSTLPDGWRKRSSGYTDGAQDVDYRDDGHVHFTFQAPDYADPCLGAPDTFDIYPSLPAEVLAAALRGGGWTCVAPGEAPALTDALASIAAERRRQVSVEGWSPEHDDAHQHEGLAAAAACYALPAACLERAESPLCPSPWPWSVEWWKPCPNDRRRELVKAGALIVAEIERLDRMAAAGVDPDEMVGGGR